MSYLQPNSLFSITMKFQEWTLKAMLVIRNEDKRYQYIQK